MKLLKRKNFQALIYAIFIALPMLSILPSTIYFAFNHEASNYTHEEVITTYEYETNEVNSIDDLVVGNIYKYEIDNTSGNYTLYTYKIYNLNLENNDRVYFTDTDFITDNTYMYRFISNPTTMYFQVYDNINDTSINNISVVNNYTYLSCYFVYTTDHTYSPNIANISASDFLGEKNVEVVESEMNPMSAFDNAIGKFVSENDFGRLDFFTFFSSLFLTNTSINNLYIHFVNWYMNYALYVSLAYLLFGVLLYFVNFFRKLVENSEDTHIGGF